MIINDSCMSCGMCVEYCSQDAIVENQKEGKGYSQYMIDSEKCIDCGACLDVDCPADAIKED